MPKYSIFATKEDYQKAYDKLKELETKHSLDFDWKKVKRTNLDSLATLIDIIKRKNGE